MDVLSRRSDGGLLPPPPTQLQDTILSCWFVLAG